MEMDGIVCEIKYWGSFESAKKFSREKKKIRGKGARGGGKVLLFSFGRRVVCMCVMCKYSCLQRGRTGKRENQEKSHFFLLPPLQLLQITI